MARKIHLMVENKGIACGASFNNHWYWIKEFKEVMKNKDVCQKCLLYYNEKTK